MKPTSRPSGLAGMIRTIWRRSARLAPLVIAGLIGLPAAAQSRDTLVLLVPDDAVATSWPVKVWTDSAAEEGVKLQTLTNAQFLALGSSSAAKIAGLIMPDSAHVKASDAVVAAVKQYANLGGKLMLVYDAGALTEAGFYAPTKSRFSDLVGVDYTLYDSLRDRVVGFGPVIGTKARMEKLSLPPGKYLPYTAASSAAGTSSTTTFVPASASDPGGTRHMQSAIMARAMKRIDASSLNVRKRQTLAVRSLLGLNALPVPSVSLSTKVSAASTTLPLLSLSSVQISTDFLRALLSGTSYIDQTGTASASDATPQAISTYGYGYVDYFSYVTTGTFSGNVWLSSPDHGLVAGTRNVGSGQVLFVNLPLGYFKAVGTDSAPLHGFLDAFARDVVKLPTMSVQPRGKGGLIYNWHVDDGDDLNSDVKYLLDSTSVLQRGPFSIHFTAGADTVALGDGMGMKLDTNSASQTQFNRLKNLAVGHELGSHGGWNHDLYGLGANEDNAATYLPWLELNHAAVDRLKGKTSTEYSAPMGNNPTWAVNWLENRGIQGMYFVGDTGAAGVRSWRAGNRLTQSMWSFPIVPQGKYATFEEFDEFGITDTQSGQWLLDLQSFVVNQRTNRMFYNHPPGARGHLNALAPLLTRADTLQALGRFKWYTMTEMAQFGNRRLGVQWSASSSYGFSSFSASHASSLKDMTWLLPRDKYWLPVITSGAGQVGYDSTNWIVTANSGTTLKFIAAQR
ncbi:MAG: hypothetical protein RLZZ592_2730 [Pseudomonadota bacterium]|jgi:hypothetical protein